MVAQNSQLEGNWWIVSPSQKKLTIAHDEGAHGIARTPNSVRNNSSGNTASLIAAQ